MKSLTLALALYTLLAPSVFMAKPAGADVAVDVAAHMEQRRTGKYNVPDFTPNMKANIGLVIAALRKYIGDPSESIRLKLIGRAAVAHRDDVGLSVRHEASELVLSAIEVEPLPHWFQNTIDHKLSSLPPSSFSPRAKQIIERILKRHAQSPHFSSVIRLIGTANVEALRPLQPRPRCR